MRSNTIALRRCRYGLQYVPESLKCESTIIQRKRLLSVLPLFNFIVKASIIFLTCYTRSVGLTCLLIIDILSWVVLLLVTYTVFFTALKTAHRRVKIFKLNKFLLPKIYDNSFMLKVTLSELFGGLLTVGPSDL